LNINEETYSQCLCKYEEWLSWFWMAHQHSYSATHVGSRWKIQDRRQIKRQKLDITPKKQTTENTAKQNYPGLVDLYNIRPGNEMGLFYNAPEPKWAYTGILQKLQERSVNAHESMKKTYSDIFTVEKVTVDKVDPELAVFFVQLAEHINQVQSHIHLLTQPQRTITNTAVCGYWIHPVAMQACASKCLSWITQNTPFWNIHL